MSDLLDAAASAAQELSWQLTGAADAAELRRISEQLLLELFGADYCGWNDFNPRRCDPVRLEIHPYHPAVQRVADELAQQLAVDPTPDHPVINHYFRPAASPAPVRMSDLISQRDLRRTKTYSEVLRPIQADYQLVILSRRDGLADASAYALTRSRTDFSDRALDLARTVQPVLVAVEAALRARSGAPAPAGHDSPVKLTARELDILQLVAAGFTAQAVAHARRISVRTVHKHLENAYAKLGVHDRLAAVTLARRLELVP